MRTTTRRLIAAAFAALILCPVADARADEVEHIGTFKDWQAFTFSEENGKVCYIASQPTKSEGEYTRRGDIYTLVTHRPARDSIGVVSVIAGYTYKPESEVTVNVDGEKFALFTEGDTAWARDSATDKALVEAMKKGLKMAVKGTSSRGTVTTDDYSLLGFTAAYKRISEACGVT